MRTGRHQESVTALTAVTGVAGILLGIIVGYMIGSGQGGGAPAVSAVTAPPQAAPAATAAVAESEIQAFRTVLSADPKNAKAAEALANKLYDAGRYAEAVPYYRQVLAGDAKNVNVSTDLATALYYAGNADEALTQLNGSLAIDPSHAQTLFNIGIVKRDGKKDPKGALEAWERLLKTNPDYSEAAKVRSLMAELPR